MASNHPEPLSDPSAGRRIKCGAFGSGADNAYACAQPWPDDCFVQCGSAGVVFSDAGGYRTAFFEAFPKEPATFIRGEGETVEAAEAAAWAKFVRARSCAGHQFEKRGYTNGAGFCSACGMFASGVFEPDPIRLSTWRELLPECGWTPWAWDEGDDGFVADDDTEAKRLAAAKAHAAWAVFTALGMVPAKKRSSQLGELFEMFNARYGIPELSDEEIVAQIAAHCS